MYNFRIIRVYSLLTHISISNYFFSKETINILLDEIIACVLELTHVCIHSLIYSISSLFTLIFISKSRSELTYNLSLK